MGTADPRASFEAGDARALRFEAEVFDAVVSGLVLNFVADPAQGLAEMMRVTRPGGTVAAYVWDYAGQGPAPGYVASLDEDRRLTLREAIRTALPTAPDGSIHLIARAWAVRGER